MKFHNNIAYTTHIIDYNLHVPIYESAVKGNVKRMPRRPLIDQTLWLISCIGESRCELTLINTKASEQRTLRMRHFYFLVDIKSFAFMKLTI